MKKNLYFHTQWRLNLFTPYVQSDFNVDQQQHSFFKKVTLREACDCVISPLVRETTRQELRLKKGTEWRTTRNISLDPSHKSHNRPEEYPNMYHFVTEMSAFLLQNDALCDMGLVHCEKNGLMIVLICSLRHNHPFYLLCYSRHGIVFIDLNCNTS